MIRRLPQDFPFRLTLQQMLEGWNDFHRQGQLCVFRRYYVKVTLVFWITPSHVQLAPGNFCTSLSVSSIYILFWCNNLQLTEVVLRLYCRCLSKNCDNFAVGNTHVRNKFSISTSEPANCSCKNSLPRKIQNRQGLRTQKWKCWTYLQHEIVAVLQNFTNLPYPCILILLLQPLHPTLHAGPIITHQLQEQAVRCCGCVLPVREYYVLRNLSPKLVHLNLIRLFRASYGRKGCWIPTKICNSGRLHNHY